VTDPGTSPASSPRGVSATLDALLFVLLVSAAVGTLALSHGSPASPSDPSADATAARLARTTASVEYTLAPGARHGPADRFPRTTGPEFDRTAHGSLADLLARAATRNLTLDGRQVTHASDHFERAVERATRNATGDRTRIRATWEPYPGAPVAGRVTVGDRPPRDATVAGATLTLDSSFPAARDGALRAANRSGYAGVARVLARAVVRGALPPEKMRYALYGDYPVDRLAAHRYRRFAALTGAEIDVAPNRTRRNNERLADAFARRFERDLRARYRTPTAAARAVRVGEVRVVVRRWSP